MSEFARRARAIAGNIPFPPASTAGIVVVLLLERVRPAPLPGPRAASRAAGAVAVAAGAAVNAWAVAERRRRTTGAFELERPESLVTTGPYALSRHPMYVGWWLIHLGAGLLRGSGWVAVTLPVAVVAEHLGAGAPEDRELEAAFGGEYERYAARVPRYLGPGLGLSRGARCRSAWSVRGRGASHP